MIGGHAASACPGSWAARRLSRRSRSDLVNFHYRVGGQPPPDGRPRDRRHDALPGGGAGQVRAVPAGQRHALGGRGQLAGQGLDGDHHFRGERPGAALPVAGRRARPGAGRRTACATWLTWVTSRPNGSMPVAGSQRPKTLARWTSQAARYCSAPPRVYSNSVRGGRRGAAGRLGWRRIRAWMEVFSSAEMT